MAHLDLFKAAAALRAEAPAKARIADFSARVLIALLLIASGLLSLAVLLLGTGGVVSLIVHSISIVAH